MSRRSAVSGALVLGWLLGQGCAPIPDFSDGGIPVVPQGCAVSSECPSGGCCVDGGCLPGGQFCPGDAGICLSGGCVPDCGLPGEACCLDGWCIRESGPPGQGLVCVGATGNQEGVCETCGLVGSPCCQGGAPQCESGAECLAFTCGVIPDAGMPDAGADSGVFDAGPDPDLRPGFPVQLLYVAGTYQSGPMINALVADIDGNPGLEIVVSRLAYGDLYVFSADGGRLSGWGLGDEGGEHFQSAGQWAPDSGWRGLFLTQWYEETLTGLPMAAFGTNGQPLPGWPAPMADYPYTPAALIDIDGDGIDEIFFSEDIMRMDGYRSDGTVLPGWPQVDTSADFCAQQRFGNAVGDLFGDGGIEIVSAAAQTSSVLGLTSCLYGFYSDGTAITGMAPLHVPGNRWYPAIGDVDGDGQMEIILPSPTDVLVLSNTGATKLTLPLTGVTSGYPNAPALADLNGDGVPEIIVQGGTGLWVFLGDGGSMPGFPILWEQYRTSGDSSPVVGDIDGDGQPDIAVETYMNPVGADTTGDVRAYHVDGTMLSGFPKPILSGSGGTPTIADLDGDGTNELVAVGDYWDGIPGWYDGVWVYEMSKGQVCGPILWGQYGGGPKHQFAYPPERP